MSPSGRLTARTGRRMIVSDTHIGHRLMAGLRGFGEDTGSHDAHVIDTWNSRVRPEDTVFHAGDVFLGPHSNIEKIAFLNGTKHLIAGNHDEIFAGHRQGYRHHRMWMAYFDSISAFLRLNLGDMRCLVSHFPYGGMPEGHGEGRYEEFRLRNEGFMLLHGHTHGSEPFTRVDGVLVPNMIHIGWDTWGGPVELDVMVRATAIELRRLVRAGE